MADNYNVSVTLDSFNGIITGNGDGTYNVTYTNLTNGQINAIGAAIEKAVEDNLPEVALSGSYEDLQDKPSIPTKVSELDNDSEYLTEETDPVFNISPAANITNQDITNWNNKSNFSGNYEDLNNKPNLNILSNETDITGFSTIAKTGSYNDLIDKPFNYINIAYYDNVLATEQEKLKLQLLGEEDTYILDINNYRHKDTNKSLIEDFQFYINDFYSNRKSLSFINYTNACYNCFDITTHSSDNNINYYILSFFKTINNNYETIRTTSNFSESIAQSQLNNLNIQSLIIGNIIIDLDNNIIYCKLLDS